MTANLHTVHVRVNDATTSQPTPVRLRITAAEGNYYPPLGRLAEFATERGCDVGGNLRSGEKQFAYIDGSCEVPLPAGQIVVEIAKGPEYRPVRSEQVLAPGKLALRFTIERWSDARPQGWYAGDTRCHYLSPHAALLEAAAEDVAVVNVLAEQQPARRQEKALTPPSIPNILEFSGQQPALARPGHLVVVNTHNYHPVLGSLGLLNCHRVVYPLCFGGDVGPDDWSLADWCDQCHRKGGLVTWTCWSNQESHGEALANVILGRVDALEETSCAWPNHAPELWYRLLNSGCRVPLVAGSGKRGNADLLGSPRTYARLREGEEFTYKNWIEAVRAGRVFMTNGPLMTFTVNEQDPGGVVKLTGNRPTVHVRATARGWTPFERLEIVFNGDALVGTETAGTAPVTASVEGNLPLPGGGWLAARCWGRTRQGETIAAHTSPIYIEVEGQPFQPDLITVTHLIEHLDRTRHWLDHGACFETARQREHLTNIVAEARAELVKRAK
ncbi:MAG: CehA/McbA family metallohydrolase [Gemmataceae bacterium]